MKLDIWLLWFEWTLDAGCDGFMDVAADGGVTSSNRIRISSSSSFFFFLLLLLLCLSPLLCVDWCRCLTGITAADSESISSVTTGDSTHLPSNWFRWIETLNCKILGGQSVETCWALATNQTPIPISGYDRLKFSFWFAGHTRWRSITRRANRSEAVTCECDIMIAGGWLEEGCWRSWVMWDRSSLSHQPKWLKMEWVVTSIQSLILIYVSGAAMPTIADVSAPPSLRL